MTRRRHPLLAWLGSGLNAPLAAAAFLGAVYAVAGASPYALRLLTVAGIQALLVVGYQFIFGHAGALSLAQATFFGLGGYVTGIVATATGWGFLATFPLALLAPVLLAALVAAPVLRLESHYFALATLGLAQLALLVAVNWQDVTGGANGLPGVPGIVVLGWALPRGLPLLAVVWATVAVAGLLAWHLTSGAWGDGFRVLRDNKLAAASIGLDGAALRFAAFLLSALYAGAAGALYAHTIRVVSPDMLGFPVMVTCLTMAMVGGRGRVAGAIVGAVLLVHLPEWLRFLGGAYLVAYGVALLGVIVLAPEGALGVLERLRHRIAPPSPLPLPAARELPPGPPPARGTLLDIAGLAKKFGGVEALADAGFTLKSGEILGLIGPNGSGKTTLVNIVTGLVRGDAGSVRLDGVEIGRKRPHEIVRSGVARTFQTASLVEAMSVVDTVALAHLAALGEVSLRRAVAGGGRALAEARGVAMAVLALLGVAGLAGLPCGSLPAGSRRLVELARALALQPRVLLLDEPAAGLGAAERGALAGSLAALARQGIGLVVIEHDMDFLMKLADRVVCLDRGRVIADGRPDAVRRDARVVAAYLGDDGASATARPT